MTILAFRRFAALFLSSLMLAACGSSGGTESPPPPPVPVAPPPPPEPTFEERLEDWAALDPNPCRARTPGFEALGGWLKDDGREIGGSRVWLRDTGALDAAFDDSHGAVVNATFNACSVREIARYAHQAAIRTADGSQNLEEMLTRSRMDHGVLISSSYAQSGLAPGADPLAWFNLLDGSEGSEIDAMLIVGLGNANGEPTLRTSAGEYRESLNEALKPENVDSARWILVGGYTGTGDSRQPARDRPTADGGMTGSSLCGEADALCLFAPWQSAGWEDSSGWIGTSIATPQVSAALDTVWAIWPDMDILDLRNLAFDCAENMTAEGVSGTDRTYSYSNGRSFTSTTNTTWGHGILSLTCLFTPNGGLQNPTTGNPISGGIFGPLAGPVTGAAITGVDYTGRNFGHGFARPVARENYALAATANLSAVHEISPNYALGRGPAAVQGSLWRSGALRVNLTAAGNAGGAAALWRRGGWILQGGLAVQPEGAGPLTGSRAFRAPSTVSAALTAAYGRTWAHDFSVHLQADHWRTFAAKGRSLWESAELSESRVSAALVKRAGRHEFALQGVWRSGLAGSLDVDGRSWALSGRPESGVWLTWRIGRH